MAMYFGYKCINKETKESGKERKIQNVACWAPLNHIPNDQCITEVTWAPNRGHSDHVKLLLPLLFPDIKYEEVQVKRSTSSDVLHYGVRFTGLENVHRRNFMFRMFAIRNIDRDASCTKTFDYLVKYGMNPLMALAVAANVEIRYNFDGNSTLHKKGYARCMHPDVTVADVKAFARKPERAANKGDQLFSMGAGYNSFIKTNGAVIYAINPVETSIQGYKATAPQFTSKDWSIPVEEFLFALTKDKHFLDPNLASLIHKGL